MTTNATPRRIRRRRKFGAVVILSTAATIGLADAATSFLLHQDGSAAYAAEAGSDPEPGFFSDLFGTLPLDLPDPIGSALEELLQALDQTAPGPVEIPLLGPLPMAPTPTEITADPTTDLTEVTEGDDADEPTAGPTVPVTPLTPYLPADAATDGDEPATSPLPPATADVLATVTDALDGVDVCTDDLQAVADDLGLGDVDAALSDPTIAATGDPVLDAFLDAVATGRTDCPTPSDPDTSNDSTSTDPSPLTTVTATVDQTVATTTAPAPAPTAPTVDATSPFIVLAPAGDTAPTVEAL